MSSVIRSFIGVAAAAVLFSGVGAQAATLTGTLSADNEYAAFISTNDAVLGTYLTSGYDWTSAQTFNTTLNPGQTYYLHVVANNWYGLSNMNGGNPDAFLGSLSLSGPGFQFANGLQTLNTDQADWRVVAHSYQTLTGPLNWVTPNETPDQWATNGDTSSIWYRNHGLITGISPDAGWIWAHIDTGGEALFSTTITSDAVPEPAAWALMIGGFGLAGAMLRRRRAAMDAA